MGLKTVLGSVLRPTLFASLKAISESTSIILFTIVTLKHWSPQQGL